MIDGMRAHVPTRLEQLANFVPGHELLRVLSSSSALSRASLSLSMIGRGVPLGANNAHHGAESPLAFVSPRIVSALVEGTLTANIRVTALANASSTLSWSEQERRSPQPVDGSNRRPV